MLRFLRNTTLFMLLAAGCVIMLWLVLAIPRKDICRTDATMLICGNSMIEYGVDDSIVPRSLNLGLNADHMEYIYAKAKLMTGINPGIDTLVIGVDDFLLCADMSKLNHATLHHFWYYDQFTSADIMATVSANGVENMSQYTSLPFQPSQIVALMQQWLGDKNVSGLGIGCHAELYHDKLKETIEAAKSDQTVRYDQIGKLQEYYLDKIRELCRERDIQLIFISMPQYFSDANPTTRKLLSRAYPDVPYYDFTTYRLPDSCYADITHLNHIGCSIFSETLKTSLNRAQ